MDTFANHSSAADAPTLESLLRLRDSMLVAHPDNIRKLELFSVPEPEAEPIRMRFRAMYDGMPIISSIHVPKTRKTGRVIWEDDPYVTYEEKDCEWGLKLGFCKEEEETVFYAIPRTPFLINTIF